MTSDLLVEIKRKDVTVRDFLDTVEAMIGLTESVAAEMAHGARIAWVIEDLQAGSATLRAKPVAPSIPQRQLTKILQTVGEGMAKLERQSKRPRYFTDRSLDFVSTLARLSTKETSGGTRFLVGNVEVMPTEALHANAERLTTARQYSLGSIEGQLQGVSSSDGIVIFVRDRLREVRVRCALPEPLLKKALRAFGKRVTITGRVWWRTDGIPKSVDVDALDVIPDDERLPSAASVRGAWRTAVGA